MLQQSARRYLKMTQHPRSDPHDQARIREFFIHGVDNFRLRWSIDALSMLLHLSIFLFFSGLLLYLFNVHHSVFYAVLSWVAASTLGYIFITAMPIFRPNCPYHAPFSILAWYLYATMVLLLLSCLSCCCSWLGNFNNLRKHYRNRISRGMEGMTKKVVQESSQEIDSCILKSVVHVPIKDHEHDRLFQCILGFCSSKIVKGPEAILRNLDRRDISSILIAHLDRTWSSNVVTKQDRIRRFVNCVKVADLARLSDVVLEILHYVFPSDKLPSDELPSDNRMVLQSVDTGNYLRDGGHGRDQEIGLCAQLVVANIIANGDQGNPSWTALATNQLGEDLIHYHTNGEDNVLLANLIHATRLIFNSFLDGLDISYRISYIVLRPLSRFDIRNTHPELQDQFWDLWEDIESCLGADSRLIHVIICLDPIYRALNDDIPTASQEIAGPLVVTHIPIVTPFTPALPVVASTSTSLTPTSGSTSLPVSTSPLPHLNNSPSLPCPAAGHARPSTSRSSPPTSSVGGFSIPASPPSARVQSVPRAKLLALLSGTPVPWPTGHQALPPLHARGLVNKGNMCFSNAVLQLLVHTPPFWELFRELGRLVGQRGRGDDQESGGVQTPLVDATVRFSEEFVYEERENWFDPTFMHDAMKDGKLSRIMRVRCFVLCRPSVSDPCWRTCIGWSRGCSRVLGPLSRRTP